MFGFADVVPSFQSQILEFNLFEFHQKNFPALLSSLHIPIGTLFVNMDLTWMAWATDQMRVSFLAFDKSCIF